MWRGACRAGYSGGLIWSCADHSTGFPRAIVVAQCGGEQQFIEALRVGDVEEIDADGRKFYAWREIATGTRYGAKHSTKVSKSMVIDGESYDKLSEAIAALGWSLGVSKKQFEQAAVTGEVPQVVYEKIAAALMGTEKVPRSGERTCHHICITTDTCFFFWFGFCVCFLSSILMLRFPCSLFFGD